MLALELFAASFVSFGAAEEARAEGRRASQRRRGRAASESVASEEARAAGTRGSQRTSREVSFISFLLGLCVCVCVS